MLKINSLKDDYFVILLIFFILNSCIDDTLSKENFDFILIGKNEAYRLSGNYNASMVLNEHYLKEAQKKNYDDGKALCYINLSNICVSIGNYKKGLLFLKKAEALLKKSKNNALKARLFQEYGQLSAVTGLSKNALKYNSKSLYYLKSCVLVDKRKYLLSKIPANRGDFLYEIDRSDSALIYFHKALDIENSPLINSLIARHHIFHSELLDSSKYYIDRSLALVKEDRIELDAQKGMVYRVAGDYYKASGNYSKAQEYYQKALNVFTNTKRVYNIPFLYRSIAETYKEMSNFEKEKEFKTKYLLAKANLSEDQNETINLLIDKILSEKENDIEAFKLKSFTIVSLGILFIVCIFIFKYRRLKNRKVLLREETSILINQTQILTTETEVLAGKVNESFNELVLLAKRNDSSFLTRFQEIYPGFVNKLLEINDELSSADLHLCAMIKLNFTSKEIANYMSILHKSAQQKKYRLRKKLNVSSDQDLYTFFQTLDS